MLLEDLKIVKNNIKYIKLFIICKYCQPITNTKKNVVQDYYFNLTNKKPIYKYL